MNTNTGYHADGFYTDLVRHLEENKLTVSISKEFSNLKNNADRVSLAFRLLDDYKLFKKPVEDKKNNELADEYRKRGNEYFKRRKIKEAIECYTQSIVNAKQKTEMLGLAYANRSAALFEKRFYKDCLQDISRAFENKYPENLKDKLMSRMKNARSLTNKEDCQPYHQKIPSISEDIRNEYISSGTNSVEIQHTNNLGRHVVAVKDIEIGDVLCVETPFCFILRGQYFNHCHECLKLCYSLIPCDNCTQVLYCNKTCKKNASVYHKYECKILRTIREVQLDKMKILPLKLCLITKNIYNDIANMSDFEQENVYLSDRYKEVHNFVGNTESRSIGDLFKRAVIAAVIFHLIKNHTDFFNVPEEEEVFKELILRHMQTAPCNFHSISEIAENSAGIYESEDIGAGVFSFISMFNHSCNPNIVRQCIGSKIAVRAIRSIKKGEQCFDNYGYHYAVMSKNDRRDQLKQQYFFDCQCDACINNWPLYQYLPSNSNDFEVGQDEVSKLMNGDVKCAETLLPKLLLRIKEVEIPQPNKQFAEKQEILKQCLALLGNVRRTL